MRPRDINVLVKDALSAGEEIQRHMGDLTLQEYCRDTLLRAGVERWFETVGEALGRAIRIDPAIAESVPEVLRVIGFRNIIAHGYDVVSDETVYRNATQNLPGLLTKLRALLNEDEHS